ncbi:hypothetical protein V6N13_001355 [Hibiscus sabdariffa]
MELRSSTHLHFVNAIKGGSVNRDFHERPTFKNKGIYNLRDTVYSNQFPVVYLKDDLESSPTKFYGVKVEKLDFSLVTGIKIKSEPEASDSNCKSDGDERIQDLDDLGFGNLTLRQLKKACKRRKRKCSNLVGLNKETMETCPGVKHEFPNLSRKDDECDLGEPLVRLKSESYKRLKSKKSSRDSDSLAPVKVEVPELGYLECQTIFGVTSVSDFNCRKQVNSTVTVSNDVVELPYPRKEPQYCSLNEVSYDYRGNMEPRCDGVSSWDIVKVDNQEIVSFESSDLSEFKKDDYITCTLSHCVSSDPMSPTEDYDDYRLVQVPETTIACGLETGSVLYPIEEPLCSVSNGVSCEYLEDVISKFVIPKLGASSSGSEIVKVGSPKIINYRCSGLQKFEQERYDVYALPCDIPQESVPPTKDCSVDLNESIESNSSEHEMAWQISSHDRTESLEMDNDDDLQCLENINEGSACFNESSSAHGRPLTSGLGPSSDDGLYRSSCLNPVRHSAPVSGHFPSPWKQSQLPDSVATDDDALDKPMASPVHPDYHQRKQQQQQPERLPSDHFSNLSRKALSGAMELTGLDKDDRQECRERLYFGNQTNHRILRAQRLDQFGRDGTTFNPKPFIRKAKQNKKGSPIKGILRVTHPSGSVPHAPQSNNVHRAP